MKATGVTRNEATDLIAKEMWNKLDEESSTDHFGDTLKKLKIEPMGQIMKKWSYYPQLRTFRLSLAPIDVQYILIRSLFTYEVDTTALHKKGKYATRTAR